MIRPRSVSSSDSCNPEARPSENRQNGESRKSNVSARPQRSASDIVSKRRRSAYRGGRSGDWLKIKCVRVQPFVIGGFTSLKGGGSSIAEGVAARLRTARAETLPGELDAVDTEDSPR